MSESRTLDSHYHMRHRAGIGMSEQSDAVVIIVSEERGEVAVAVAGEMTVMSDETELQEYLDKELKDDRPKKRKRRRRKKKAHSDEQQADQVTEATNQ